MRLQIVLLTGLPGCGKTIYTYKNYPTGSNDYSVWDEYGVHHLDEFLAEDGSLQVSRIRWTNNWSPYREGTWTLVIDGFLPTKKARIEVIKSFIENLLDGHYRWLKSNHIEIEVTEHYWTPDIDACIDNDSNRINKRERKKESRWTILNAKLEDPLSICDFGSLGLDHYSLKVADTQYETTKRYVDNPLYCNTIMNREEFGQKDDSLKYIYSRWYDCEDDWKYAQFDELDEVIERVCPDITYLKYKKIARFIEVEKDHVCDYYDSHDRYRYKIPIDKIHEILLLR